MAILNAVFAQIRDIRKDHREPIEVRLGTEDYSEMLAALQSEHADSIEVSTSGNVRLFGVPVRKLPIRRAVSVI